MSNKFQISQEKGQTLLEILVALAAAVLIATAFVTLGATSVRNSVFSKNQATATQFAQEAIEGMISIRDQNAHGAILGNGANDQWSSLFGQTMTCTLSPTSPCPDTDFRLQASLCLLGSPTPTLQRCLEKNSSGESITANNTTFTRKIRITDSAIANIKTVTAFVWWTDAQGTHNSALTRAIRKDKLQ